MRKIYFKLTAYLTVLLLLAGAIFTVSAEGEYLDLSSNKTYFSLGSSDTIKVYSDGQKINDLSGYTFSSSNTNCFTVDESGVITASDTKAGRSVITVSNGAATNKYMVICGNTASNTGLNGNNYNSATSDPTGRTDRSVYQLKTSLSSKNTSGQSAVTAWIYVSDESLSGGMRNVMYIGGSDGQTKIVMRYNHGAITMNNTYSAVMQKGWYQFTVICKPVSGTTSYDYSVYHNGTIMGTQRYDSELKYVTFCYADNAVVYVYDINAVAYDSSNEMLSPSSTTELTGIEISGLKKEYNPEDGTVNMGDVKEINTTTTPAYTDMDGLLHNEEKKTQSGDTITSGLTFLSENENICTVNNDGNLTPVAEGVANIRVSYEGFTETMKILVKPEKEVKTDLDTSEATVEFTMAGGALFGAGKAIKKSTKTVRPAYDFGENFKASEETIGIPTIESITTGISYSSDNSNISVNESGIVSATAAGLANITVTFGELSEAIKILVKPDAVKTYKLDTSGVNKKFFGDGSIGVISLKTISATPGYVALDGTSVDEKTDVSTTAITSGITFTSSQPSICTVAASGAVTVLDSGSSAITIEYGELSEVITVECYSQEDIDNIVTTLKKADITVAEIESMIATLGIDISGVSNKVYIYNYLQTNKADYNNETEFTAITEAFKASFDVAKTKILALEASLTTAKKYLEDNKIALGIDGIPSYEYFKTASEEIQTAIIAAVKKVGADSEIKATLDDNAVKIAINSLFYFSQVYSEIEKFTNADIIAADLAGYAELNSEYKNSVQYDFFVYRTSITDASSVTTKFNSLVTYYKGIQSGGGGSSLSGGTVSNSSSSNKTSSVSGTLYSDKSDEEAYELPKWVEEERQAEIAAENIFSDLTQAEWAKEYIKDLYTKNIISGYPDGTFGVNNNITREEIVKLLVLAGNLKATGENQPTFTDVPSDAWYYEYVKIAVENGIVNGIGDNKFGVGQNITREEMSAMLYRLCNVTNIILDEEITVFPFKDQNEISSWANNEVKILRESYLIDGYSDNTFKPKDNLTRSQAAKLIYGYLHYND